MARMYTNNGWIEIDLTPGSNPITRVPAYHVENVFDTRFAEIGGYGDFTIEPLELSENTENTENTETAPVKRGRGRPAGSKNKPKN